MVLINTTGFVMISIKYDRVFHGVINTTEVVMVSTNITQLVMVSKNMAELFMVS